MTIQAKLLSFGSILNRGRIIFGNGYLQNLPGFQQIAYIRRSLEEKLQLPPKPKRPLTPYFKFMTKIRPEVVRELPNVKTIDIVREIASRWEKIDPQMKQKFEVEYKKEQEIYSKQKLEYDTKLTQEQKNALKQARLERIESKEKRIYRKKCRENNKPKKPCSAFVLYMNSQLPKRGSKDINVWRKEIAGQWHLLSNEEKKPFMEDMNRRTREYQKEMVEWERKMIKMGNTDIVRQDALIDPKSKQKGKKTE